MSNERPLRHTKHLQTRMSQRGIPGELVSLVRQYGRNDQDRLILDRKELRVLLDRVRDLQRVVLKALDKGGVIVVEANGAVITTYNVGSFDGGARHE